MIIRPEVGESPTLQFAEAARLRREAGLPIVSLGLGEPDFATPDVLINSVSEVLAEGNSHYSSPLGVPGLRERIAEKFHKDNGINVSPGRVLVAAGAKQALSMVLMAMLQPGDEVIVIAPFFVSFIPQIYLAEPNCTVRIVNVCKDTHELSMDELEAVFNSRTRAILLNTPNNPAGYMLSSLQLEQVLALAVEHDSYVISDEVYEKLVFGDAPHVSIGSLESKADRVITINGFSKSHALTGWRIGYTTLPDSLAASVLKIQQHQNTNTCTFVQRALEKSWDFNCEHLQVYREVLSRRASNLQLWLNDMDSLSALVPQAGFFVFLNIRALGCTSNAFCAGLLENVGVATTPGIAFGPDWDDHVRLSFAVDQGTLDSALALLTQYVRSLEA